MHKEIVVPFSDLQTVSVECGDCHALLILDIQGPRDVTCCAACNREFRPPVRNTLKRLHELLVETQDSPHKISFRIRRTEIEVA